MTIGTIRAHTDAIFAGPTICAAQARLAAFLPFILYSIAAERRFNAGTIIAKLTSRTLVIRRFTILAPIQYIITTYGLFHAFAIIAYFTEGAA
jgi:hypothetical protein